MQVYVYEGVKMKRYSIIPTCLALFFLLAGCATMINGSKQTVTLMSEPPGATVTVGGEFTTRTPAALPLTRGKDYQVLFQKEGYKDQTVLLKSSFAHWVQSILGNVWNYILPGLVIDIASGGAYEFDQVLINAQLEENKKEAQAN